MCSVMRRQSGHTLLELIVVTALVGMVALAVYSVFSGGLRIWDRLNRHSGDEGITRFFYKFSLDVRNGFHYADAAFSGDSTSLSFTSFRSAPDAENGEAFNQVGYAFNRSHGRLTRSERGIREIYGERDGRMQTLMEDVSSARFKYYYYDPVEETYRWESKWPPDPLFQRDDYEFMLPAAVHVEVVLDETQGERTDYEKRIFIPAGR